MMMLWSFRHPCSAAWSVTQCTEGRGEFSDSAMLVLLLNPDINEAGIIPKEYGFIKLHLIQMSGLELTHHFSEKWVE